MGATIHMHYCMNELVGWSLFHSEKDKECAKCGMKEKNNFCCKDEHKYVKLDIEHQKTTITQYLQLLDTPLLVIPFADFCFKGNDVSTNFPIFHSPPKTLQDHLYILNCVFLI